jgi:hypothetical protein
MSLVQDKDDILDNLAVVDAITVVLRALAYGETVELDGTRLEMQEGLMYIRPYQLVKGELVDIDDRTQYMGMNHLPWEYWVRVVKELSPERLLEIKLMYAIKATLNPLSSKRVTTEGYNTTCEWRD